MESQILDPSILKTMAKQSMRCVNEKKPDECISYLKVLLRQLQISKDQNPNPQLFKQEYRDIQIIAHNNLACACARKGKYKQSLYHLQIAKRLQSQNYSKRDDINSIQIDGLLQMATTHSNICAVYSKTHNHKKALEEIQLAIILLQTAQQKLGDKDPIKAQQVINALIIANYNCSVQLQYVSNLTKSHTIANQAVSLIKKIRQNGFTLRNRNIEVLLQENVNRLEQKMKSREVKMSNYIRTWQKGVGTYQKVHQDQSILFASRIEDQRKNPSKNMKGSSSTQISLKFRKNFDLDMKNKFTVNKKLYPQRKFYQKFHKKNSQFPRFNSNQYKMFQLKKSESLQRPKKYDSEKTAEIRRNVSQSQQACRISIKKRQKFDLKQNFQSERLYLNL